MERAKQEHATRDSPVEVDGFAKEAKACVQEEALNWADSTEKWRQEAPGRGSKLIKHRTMSGDGSGSAGGGGGQG